MVDLCSYIICTQKFLLIPNLTCGGQECTTLELKRKHKEIILLTQKIRRSMVECGSVPRIRSLIEKLERIT